MKKKMSEKEMDLLEMGCNFEEVKLIALEIVRFTETLDDEYGYKVTDWEYIRDDANLLRQVRIELTDTCDSAEKISFEMDI